MHLDQEIEIPVHKRKALLLLGLALCFIAFGLFTIFFADEIPFKVYIAGLVCIPFFGLGAIILYRRYKSNKPGLIINCIGITDNGGGDTIGPILWQDIEAIYIQEIQKQRLIMVSLYNPEDYIEKADSFWLKKTMQFNYKFFGTPISISNPALDIDSNELYMLLIDCLKESREIV